MVKKFISMLGHRCSIVVKGLKQSFTAKFHVMSPRKKICVPMQQQLGCLFFSKSEVSQMQNP